MAFAIVRRALSALTLGQRTVAAFLVPATTSIRAYFETPTQITTAPVFIREPFQARSLEEGVNVSRSLSPFTFELNTDLALILIGLYGFFYCIAVSNWSRPGKPRAPSNTTRELEGDDNIAGIINKCESDLSIGPRRIRVLRSKLCPCP